MVFFRSARVGVTALAAVIGATGIACAKPAPTAGPSPAEDTVTSAPAVLLAGPSGATLTVATAGGSADYTLGNLRQVPLDAQIVPAKGAMYSVDVRIAGIAGTTSVNGFYFVARAADGSTIAPAVGAVRPGITSGQLTEGQTVEGLLAFDAPPAATITAVALRDPQGRQLAVWSLG